MNNNVLGQVLRTFVGGVVGVVVVVFKESCCCGQRERSTGEAIKQSAAKEVSRSLTGCYMNGGSVVLVS